MIHMEYYLVVSTIMMFAGIYGFFTRRNTLAILISVENAECYGHQLRRVQSIPFSGGNGGLFLCTLFHRHLGCGNCNSYRHHD